MNAAEVGLLNLQTSGPQSPREASQQPARPARPQHPPLLSLPSLGHRHRRAKSEVAFRLPDDLGLGSGGGGGPDGDAFDEIGSEDDLFSTFMDIEKISSSGPSNRDRDRAAETSSPPRPKHRHSSSIDGSGLFFSPGIGSGAGKDAAVSLAEVMEAKNAMTPEQLAELAAIDPKRAKRETASMHRFTHQNMSSSSL
ncbi:transcription factor RF2b-like [Miscanthus floridulus]|uniref:transcription factor RF2b-like n=1 Tax=Miscanthus floridulus TaxID=154761 RepID=UPI00345840F0